MNGREKFVVLAVFAVMLLNYLGSYGLLNGAIWTLIQLFCIGYFMMFIIFRIRRVEFRNLDWSLKLFLAYILMRVFFDFFTVSDYWEIKQYFLGGLPYVFASFIVLFERKDLLHNKLMNLSIPMIIVIVLLLLPIFKNHTDIISKSLIFVFGFTPFFQGLKLYNRLLLISVLIVIPFINSDFRTGLIKVTVGLCIITIPYIKLSVVNFLAKRTFLIIALLPLGVLFWSSLVGESIFALVQDFVGESQAIESGLEDTRSFLYVEVFSSLEKANSFVFGVGLDEGYHSNFFDSEGGAINGSRYNTEVGFLNYLLHLGLIGVLLYLLLLLRTLRLIIKLRLGLAFGLFILTKIWLFFVEDYWYVSIDLLIFWIFIGTLNKKYGKEGYSRYLLQ